MTRIIRNEKDADALEFGEAFVIELQSDDPIEAGDESLSEAVRALYTYIDNRFRAPVKPEGAPEPPRGALELCVKDDNVIALNDSDEPLEGVWGGAVRDGDVSIKAKSSVSRKITKGGGDSVWIETSSGRSSVKLDR